MVYFGARMDKRSQLKMQGYEQAMLKHGLSPHSITTAEHSSFTLGASQLKQALQHIPQLDGIFAPMTIWQSGHYLSANG